MSVERSLIIRGTGPVGATIFTMDEDGLRIAAIGYSLLLLMSKHSY